MTDSGNPADDSVTHALRLHERAVRDINAAFVRLAELVSEDAAFRWRDSLREAIASLATNPRRCHLAPEPFRREVRQLLHRPPHRRTAYRILFTMSGEEPGSPEGPTVTILHIRHAAARPVSRRERRELDSG